MSVSVRERERKDREWWRRNGPKRFRLCGSALVSVSPSKVLAQGQAAASAPLQASIGFEQKLRPPLLPSSVIGFFFLLCQNC